MICQNTLFRRFTVGPYPINGYLIADTATRIGAFIDPGGFDDQIAKYIDQQKIDLRFIFFTHGHEDHTGGLREFVTRYSLDRCYAGHNEVGEADCILTGGEHIEVGSLQFITFSTPGHSPGAITYYCPPRVFTGDALFCGSMGGTSDPKLAEMQIKHVRNSIFSLPDSTLVYPGHGPMTTVAAEKYANPFFQPAQSD